jgi:hypothetical protein
MQKIAKSKIIGFEIIYSDMEGDFVLEKIFEGEELPEESCTSFYVPFKGQAYEVSWEYECGKMDPLGVEFELCGKCPKCVEERQEHKMYCLFANE